MTQVYMVLIITAMTCSIIGPFLLLRNLSMVCDALSHSVLLGIVLAFIIVKDLDSPILVLGAGIFGVITVWVVEKISSMGLVKNDDALGIVFPMFFSIAVIIISKFFRNVHLDVDIVLMGEVLLSPFTKLFSLPRDFVIMSILFVVNLMYISIFFRSLKLLTFDKDYAFMQKIKINMLFYTLMVLTSITSVTAFNTVGAILVISFFITPTASAYLVAKSLRGMIIWSMIFGIINSSIGFLFAIHFNLSVSGMCSFVGMIVCIIVIIFNKDGLIVKLLNNKKIKLQLDYDLLLLHLYRHKSNDVETGFENINKHLNWDRKKSDHSLNYLIEKKLVSKDEDKSMYMITSQGIEYVENLLKA